MEQAEQAKFDALLNALLSPDGTQRNAAERALEQLDAVPSSDQLVVFLMSAIRNMALPVEVRQMACSLLSARIIKHHHEEGEGATTVDKKNIYDRASAGVQAYLKRELLAAYQAEKERRVSHRLAGIISDVSALISSGGGRGEWPELLPFVFQLARSDDPKHRECGLTLFGDMAASVGPEPFRPFFGVVQSLLSAGMGDAAAFEVRLAALEATAVFLAVMKDEDAAAMRQFNALVPQMLECVTVALQHGREEDAQSAIQEFISVMEAQPSFLMPSLTQVMQTMFAVASHEQLSVATRTTALEMLVSMCEYRPGAVKKVPGFVDSLVDLLLRWLATVSEFPEWTNFENVDEDTLDSVAEEELDRLSIALHGKTLVPVIFGRLNYMLSNADWRARHAAMTAITVSAEGCASALKPHVAETLRNVLAVTRDPHMRVRWAAVNCVSQLCTDFGPQIQRRHGAEIVDAFCTAMKDPVQRVAACAAIGIINFAEDGDEDVTVRYSPQLYASLQQLLASPVVRVQEAAITAFTRLLEDAPSQFEPFYGTVVPYLKSVLHNAKQKEYRLIRGKAVECLMYAGAAVGKERFAADASEALAERFSTKLEADDPQISYYQSAFGSLSELLGEDFVQFLPQVMPATLQLASTRAEVEELKPNETAREGWEEVEVGGDDDEGLRVQINSSAMEDKASALQILAVYASNLGAGFQPYVEQCLSVALGCLDFEYNDEVRANAHRLVAFCLKNLASCARRSGSEADASKLFVAANTAIPAACKALAGEATEPEVAAQGFAALNALVTAFAAPFAPPAELLVIVARCIKTSFAQWQKMQQLIDKERAEEGADDGDDSGDEVDREVGLVLETICDTNTECLKQFGDSYAQIFATEVLPCVLEHMNASRGWRVVHRAGCCFCDAVEYSPFIAANYAVHGLDFARGYLASSLPEMRQLAVYYIGAAMQALPVDAALPHAAGVYAAMQQQVAQLDQVAKQESDGHWASARDNAVAAAIKVVLRLAAPMGLVLRDAFAFIIGALPFTSDDEEADKCYPPLLEMFAANAADALGPNLANVPKLIAFAAFMISNKQVQPANHDRVRAALQTLFSTVPPQALMQLPQQQLATIQAFTTGAAPAAQ